MSSHAPTLEISRPDPARQDPPPVQRPRAPHPGRSGSRRLGALLVLTDLAASGLGWFLVGPVVLRGSDHVPMATGMVLATVATPLVMGGLGLHRSAVCTSRFAELVRIAVAVAVAYCALLGLEWAGFVLVDGVEAAWVAAATVACLLVGRSAYRAWITAARVAGRYRRPLVLVGEPAELDSLTTFYDEHPALGYDVVGAVSDHPEQLPPGLPWYGCLDDDGALDAVAGVGGAVLALGGLPADRSNRLLRRLAGDGVRVQVHTGLSSISHRRLRTMDLAHEPLQFLDPPGGARARAVAKRALDVSGAVAALVLAAPVVALAAVGIRLEDGHPIMFRQERVGRGGRTFTMLKLRTMVVDAEARADDVRSLNLRRGPLFKAGDDPRVTRVGRWLRALSIDELPQLVNVLRGEMSLVGPRPALASETEQFDEELRRARAQVRPGMTGLWQVEAADSPSIYLYRRLDLYYVENWTVVEDLCILARTAWTVVARGARRIRRGERS